MAGGAPRASHFAGSVGVIGIGAMGAPMARHLQRSGYAPRVRDIDPAAVAAAAADGLAVCDSAAALARECDVVLVVVVDAAQIEAVLFGDDGVVRAGRAAGAPRQAVVLCSTIAAADTERFHARLVQAGIDCIDAPVSGGPARAGNGSLSMMVAADPAVFERCEPLLRTLASALHRVGERIGDAARVKLVNNLLAGIHLAAAAQAMALAQRLGLDPRALFDVVRASSGASWMLDDRMPRVLAHDYAPRARTAILTKDVGLALALARAAGVEVPLGDAAWRALHDAMRSGLADADDAAVIGSALGLLPGRGDGPHGSGAGDADLPAAPIRVRSVERDDRAAWGPLWDGYNAFYGRSGATALPAAVTEATWQRFFVSTEPVFALVAVQDGRLAGLAHYLFHRSTTRIEPVCYLQDLFTAPAARGRGVGRALIEAVVAQSAAAGAQRVYWHTHAGNAAGRALYDKVAQHLGFIVYSHPAT